MSLIDRLKSREPKKTQVAIGDDTLYIHELDNATVAKIRAGATNSKGVVDNLRLERMFLAACVHDSDGKPVASDQAAWHGLRASDHVALVSECMTVNGFDYEKQDPKDSGSTTT